MAKNHCPKKDKKSYWTIKITIITFIIAMLFSFVSEFATSRSGIIVASILLVILIIIGIIFDGIGVAVTACDMAPLTSMASKKVKGSKIAIKLKSNADKVANICADVIGDICGIISGACVVVLVLELNEIYPTLNTMLITILISSVVASLIVGGKALMKTVAITKSTYLVMLVAKFLKVFVKESKL